MMISQDTHEAERRKAEWNQARFAERKSLEDLGHQIIELAGHLNAANYRFLMLIAEWDRRKGWGGDSATQSCAHWLNWKCGIDMGAAREKVRTANALVSLPKIGAAMERGELSYAKVRALTRVACPNTESTLLNYAIHGTAAHVERIVRDFRRCKEAEELSRDAQQHANRKLNWFHDEEGMLVIKARLPPEAGQLFIKAMEAAQEKIPAAEISAETSKAKLRPEPSARKVDALAIIAESFLAHGPAALKGGDRHQIVLHVDAETLRDSAAGRCNFEHGPSVSAETSRRLSCDCSIVPIVENDDGEPLSVGRKTRSIPPALHRALNSRDKGCCRFPGCPNTRYLDGHHIKHWAHGGETKLSNLVSLCRFHHRQVHEGNVVVRVLDDGAIRFVMPNGNSFDSTLPDHTRPLANWQQLIDEHEEQGLHIDRHTAATRWDGEACDYSMAVDALLRRWRQN
ncbi:HNH endonuclease signature motif containing protein [Steroidobacter cummioxidans]|uniref:HNH endonuclease signature motif containing protein n=1 Tax=Steroidobacter cummioxidans TaxID=1803913 RepID=UPI000E312FC3|nr:HNH endonuclease signature motif containing protein [Steroidobacter cummioxidans]